MTTPLSREELRSTIMSCSNQVYVPYDTKDYTGVEIGVEVLELESAIEKLFNQSLKAFADEVESKSKSYVIQVNQSDGYEVTEEAIPVSALKELVEKWGASSRKERSKL